MSSSPVRVFGLAVCAVAIPTLGASQGMTNGAYPQALYHKPEPSVERLERMGCKAADYLPTQDLPRLTSTPCVDGEAAGFPCWNVDLLALLPMDEIGGDQANDIWGWTDPSTGKEYVILGRTNGTSFIDISDPVSPVYLGDLPTRTITSTWRDMKVHRRHVFIVADWAEEHGMQIFDLAELRSVASPPVTFAETAHYDLFNTAHNIAINRSTGFAYAIGSDSCAGGPHVVDVDTPTAPTFAGCVDGDGYTHDAQCVRYRGPDTAYSGRELCFNYNEDTLTIVDVSDKSAPIQISRTGYPGRGYTHQGWLSDDHMTLVMDDEFDELRGGVNTRTHFWDVSDLDAPVHLGAFQGETIAIDHNQFVVGRYVYQSNYRAGLRILDFCCTGASEPIREVAYFDVFPDNDSPRFNGSWSNYPFFRSGVVAVAGSEQGLFLVRPNLPPSDPVGCINLGASPRPLPQLVNGLRTYRSGGDVAVVLQEAPPSDGGFNVHRSTSEYRQGPVLEPPITTRTSDYLDVGAVYDGTSLWHYEARSITDCGLGGP